MYKDALSSDGLNLDEVRASVALDHPHVLKFLGYWQGEPRRDARVRGDSSTAHTSVTELGALLEWQVI